MPTIKKRILEAFARSRSLRRLAKVGLLVLVAIAAVYVWALLSAREEAGQTQQQETVDSVVRALGDSIKADSDLRQLLLAEQQRTDSATRAEQEMAAEAEADRKVAFLWSVLNEAAAKYDDNQRRAVFESRATENFKRFLTQRKPALPELLFFPLDNLAATSVWHYQQDWFAVSAPPAGSYVLRIVTAGGAYRIDNIIQASRPKQDEADTEPAEADYDDEEY
ncbi:MAG: hypothetical protein IJS89_02515 [Bacteroidaceae bacterium]|nr:hypothetical protein [Bacteroidaceae bacterium]